MVADAVDFATRHGFKSVYFPDREQGPNDNMPRRLSRRDKTRQAMQLSKSFLISEMALFDSLNVDEVQEIQKWLIFKKLDQGTVIYKQGSSGRSVCFVVDGELNVIKRADEGDATIAKIGKGESVGEMAIIDGLTRSADVVAATEAQVLILKRDDFDKLVAEQPEIGVKILRSLARALSMTLRDRSETLARLMHV